MTEITNLSSDLLSLILSLLPLPSLIKSSTVCKLWHSLISSPFFSPVSSPHHPWFFLHGIHNTSSKNNQTFAFDPSSNSWHLLPTPPHTHPNTSFIGTSSFFFITAPNFLFTPILHPSWHPTPPLHFPRINPLLAVFKDSNFGPPKFIVVAGVKFIGNLVDIEDRLDVEIYDPLFNSWDLGPPLPPDFRSGNSSSSSLSSALYKGKFYVFGIYSCFLSSFDLKHKLWSEVHILRPHGVLFSFLVACRTRLVLAGVCTFPHGSSSFVVWDVDERDLGLREIAVMPHDFMCAMFDGDEEDKLASLKCVGMGDLVYVFNEDYHRMYPACVCEIDGESGRCSWRRVPQLPSMMNRFHKVVSFCSTVSLHGILGQRQRPGLQY